jgi:hypothetical protein
MTVKRIEADNKIRVSLDGSAQIGDAESIAQDLLAVLESSAADVSLSLDGIAQVDVSFFQIVLAMGASLAAISRRVSIEALPAEHIVAETSDLLGIDLGRFIPKSETLR